MFHCFRKIRNKLGFNLEPRHSGVLCSFLTNSSILFNNCTIWNRKMEQILHLQSMKLFIFHCYKLYHEVSTICSFNRGNITVSQCKGQYDHSRERTQSSLDKHTICDGLNLYPSDQIPVPVVPKPRNE